MAISGEKIAKDKCILCNTVIEKSNLGYLCNECKDKLNRGTIE